MLCTSPLSPPSETEAKLYYSGLPSAPVVACTSTAPWKQPPPTDLEADHMLKELRVVGNHPIKEAWEDSWFSRSMPMPMIRRR